MSDELYSVHILNILNSAIPFEKVCNECHVYDDDYERLQSVCIYMEKIIKEIKELPDTRVKNVGCLKE